MGAVHSEARHPADSPFEELPAAISSGRDSGDLSDELAEVLSEMERVQQQCRAVYSKVKALREQRDNLASSSRSVHDEGSTGCTLNLPSPAEHQGRDHYTTPQTQLDEPHGKFGVPGDTGSTLGIGRAPTCSEMSPNHLDADKIDTQSTEDAFSNGAASPTALRADKFAELEAACDAEEEHALYLQDLAAFLHHQACEMHRGSTTSAAGRNFVV